MTTRIDFTCLIQTHQMGVWRFLRALGCQPSEADDLTQETFLAVLEKPFQDQGPTATAAYLRTIAKNLFVSALRKANRLVAVEDLDELERLDEIEREWQRWAGHDDGEAFLAALNLCLQTLGERAREALNLKYRHNKSRTAIATALSMTEDGAKNLLQRTKQALRDCIERRLASKTA